MPNEMSWNTVEEATSAYCLETSLILKWVEQGAVRAEQPDTREMKVNVEDLEQMVGYLKKCTFEFRDCDWPLCHAIRAKRQVAFGNNHRQL